MTLAISWEGSFNPFDFILCPLCGGSKFTSVSCAAVWCDRCNTRFSVRPTAGDPGCVVDAFADKAYGPAWVCSDESCGFKFASLSKSPVCPACGSSCGREDGVSRPLGDAERERTWYHVLKTGDYSSGWLVGKAATLRELKSHPGGHRQAEWDLFQGRPDFTRKDVEQA